MLVVSFVPGLPPQGFRWWHALGIATLRISGAMALGLFTGQAPQPQEMRLHKGMRLHLTRNINKEADFINGMEATVAGYDPTSKCVHVVTKTNRNLAVYPVTEYVEERGYVTAYPFRPGYASTIHKLQGAQLAHVTIWLDIKGAKAAGYVAISRAESDENYLLGGVLKRRHFVPAM